MSKAEYLRDKFGNILGQITGDHSRYLLWDHYGNLLGWYDWGTNWTGDRHGSPIGQGNLLTTLLNTW